MEAKSWICAKESQMIMTLRTKGGGVASNKQPIVMFNGSERLPGDWSGEVHCTWWLKLRRSSGHMDTARQRRRFSNSGYSTQQHLNSMSVVHVCRFVIASPFSGLCVYVRLKIISVLPSQELCEQGGTVPVCVENSP